jgi:hypothetical protein
MKKIFMAGAVIISVMAFATATHSTKNCTYRTYSSYMDTVPTKKTDTTKWPKRDTTMPKKDTSSVQH